MAHHIEDPRQDAGGGFLGQGELELADRWLDHRGNSTHPSGTADEELSARTDLRVGAVEVKFFDDFPVGEAA